MRSNHLGRSCSSILKRACLHYSKPFRIFQEDISEGGMSRQGMLEARNSRFREMKPFWLTNHVEADRRDLLTAKKSPNRDSWSTFAENTFGRSRVTFSRQRSKQRRRKNKTSGKQQRKWRKRYEKSGEWKREAKRIQQKTEGKYDRTNTQWDTQIHSCGAHIRNPINNMGGKAQKKITKQTGEK